MRLLLNYHWPGNVRQLEAVVERAILLSEGPEIKHYDLPIEVRFFDLPAQPVASSAPGGKFASRSRSMASSLNHWSAT